MSISDLSFGMGNTNTLVDFVMSESRIRIQKGEKPGLFNGSMSNPVFSCFCIGTTKC